MGLKLNRSLCRRKKGKTLLADPQPYSPMKAEIAIPLIPTRSSIPSQGTPIVLHGVIDGPLTSPSYLI